MPASNQEFHEIDHDEWDRVWGNRTLRLLPSGCKLDVSHFFPVEKLSEVTIAIDPHQFADRNWQGSEICPVCGETTLQSVRIAASINLMYEQGLQFGCGVGS